METLCNLVQGHRGVVESLLERDDLTQEVWLDVLRRDHSKLVEFEQRLMAGEKRMASAVAWATYTKVLSTRTKTQMDLALGNGGLGGMSSQNQRLTRLEGSADAMKEDFANTLNLLLELDGSVQSLHNTASQGLASAGQSLGGNGPGIGDLQKQAEDTRVKVERLSQKMAGGGISTSVGRFDLFSGTLTFVKEYFLSEPVYLCFVDIMIAFGWVEDSATYQEELQM